MYDNENTKCAEILKNVTVCLTIDGWSNVHNEPILCACVITSKGNVYFVETIDTSGQSHNATCLTQLLTETVIKIQDKFKCFVGSIVTDYAANMALMRNNISMQEPEIITYGCSAHYLNLLAHDVKIPAVTQHAIKICKYFRNNHFARAKFH